MPTSVCIQWAIALCFVALPLLTGASTDFGTSIEDAILPVGLPAVAPAAGELRGTATANNGIVVVNDAVAVVETPVAPMNEAGVNDTACQLFEDSLQKKVKNTCNITKTITCVWGDTSICSAKDYCNPLENFENPWNPSKRCFYVEENQFFKFDDYSCKGLSIEQFKGAVTCNPTLT